MLRGLPCKPAGLATSSEMGSTVFSCCFPACGTGIGSATNSQTASLAVVAKMTSHAIFQYNVLAIDDTLNTWTNMIVKMTILRLLDSSDDKEKIGVMTILRSKGFED